MRKYHCAVIAVIVFTLFLAREDAFAEDCTNQRIEDFIADFREASATIRVDVDLVDDDCNQTTHFVLLGALEDRFLGGAIQVGESRALESSAYPDSEVPPNIEGQPCDGLQVNVRKLAETEEPKLQVALEQLSKLKVSIVPDPRLVIHGRQYGVRVRSGLSKTDIFFLGENVEKSPGSGLYPLFEWIQELFKLFEFDSRCG